MDALIPLYIIIGTLGFVVLVSILRSIRIVPSRTALVVERLGKFNRTLEAGFHVLLPFFDRVAYKNSLKEVALDVPDQTCFTEDNVKIKIGGVLYYMVTDPKKASYGINNFRYAIIQLAQTTMRSVIGLLELDRTFAEREHINGKIVQVLDEATEEWGVKVTRYEIQNITIPPIIQGTMELQVKAERDKRALIAKSQGEMNSRINNSIGVKEEAINKSEGEKQRRINEAEGKAAEILALSKSTAVSIEKVAQALQVEGGEEAVSLQVTERLLSEISSLANKHTKIILPLDLTDLGSVTKLARQALSVPPPASTTRAAGAANPAGVPAARTTSDPAKS
jgi:regulator of protease activity HflC (stomatin/prohibitin superfamily)